MHRLAFVLVLVLAAFVACKKKEAGKTDGTVPTLQDAAQAVPAADAVAAQASAPPTAVDHLARGKQLLDAQVAALLKDDAAMTATFDAEAVVLVPDPRKVSEDIGLRAAITRLAPSAELKSVTADKIIVGGNVDALWLTAELTVTQATSTTRVRVTELATSAAGWKVVAGAFTETSTPSMRRTGDGDVKGATDAGPLTPLLTDPAQLGGKLVGDAVVFGPNERADGADAAKQLLAGWTSFALEGKPREVRGPTWGFALGHIEQVIAGKKAPYRWTGLVIAVPDAGGTWSVVAAHYTAR